MDSTNQADNLRLRARLQDVNSDKERLELIWQNYRAKTEANKTEKPFEEFPEKDARIAQDLKEKGNLYYAQKQFPEALLSYNWALCKAPSGSSLIPLIYANRSAVYFEAGIYLKALENIDLAIENGYPVEKRDKLEERRTRCLNLMAKLPDEKIYIKHKPALNPLLSHEAHSKYPFLSKAVDIKMDADRGPILVAQEELKVGDIFFKEPVFLKAIGPREGWTPYGTCAYCMESNLLSLIPCADCSVALFCKNCLPKAEEVHRFECPILKRMYYISEIIPRLPNRMVLDVRMIIHVLRLFDLEHLDQEILDLQTDKAKLLEGDYNNDVERQIIKWIFARSEETTLDKWMWFGAIFNLFMITIMLSPPLKALISTPEKEITILNVFFHLHKQKLVEVTDGLRAYFAYQPMKIHFSMANIGAEVNAQINPDRDHFIYSIRPIRKEEEIKFRLICVTFAGSCASLPKMSPTLVREMNMGHSGPFMDQYRSYLLPEFQRMDKKIQNFDAAAEMLKMFATVKQDLKKNLKEKERVIRLLTENDDMFPCFDIAVLLRHLVDLIRTIYTPTLNAVHGIQ